MKSCPDSIEDENTMTEITVQPDGRVFVFGTSRNVLDILIGLNPRSSKLNRLIGRVRSIESEQHRTTGREAHTAPLRSK
jgi:hypothetical protein